MRRTHRPEPGALEQIRGQTPLRPGIQAAALRADTLSVDPFFENARRILDTASAADTTADTTILFTEDGGLRILADSDWPLDRLVAHLGARSAYRVSARRGAITVEGRSRTQSCVLERVRYPIHAGISQLLPAA